MKEAWSSFRSSTQKLVVHAKLWSPCDQLSGPDPPPLLPSPSSPVGTELQNCQLVHILLMLENGCHVLLSQLIIRHAL